MNIFELTKPGIWLKLSKIESENFQINNLIDHLIDTFYEANAALNLYLEEKQDRELYIKDKKEQKINDKELENRIREKIKLEYQNVNIFEKQEEIYFRAEIEFKKNIWEKGRVPSMLKLKMIIIHAKSFIYALDNFEKQFKKLLENELIPKQCVSLHNNLIKSFPNLKGLRDSAHHLEDRIRGEKHGKKITLMPISNSLIHAPQGGALITNTLNNDYFYGTLGDGTLGQIEVSVETMRKLHAVLQDFLNALIWKGEREHLPS